MALLGYGNGVGKALEAAAMLADHGIQVTVADARFAKPLDAGLVAKLAREHDLLVTIEENVLPGGFGAAVLETSRTPAGGRGSARVLRVGLPDRYVTHGKPGLLRAEVGLTGARIAERVRRAILDPESETETVGRSSSAPEGRARGLLRAGPADARLQGPEMKRPAGECGPFRGGGIQRGADETVQLGDAINMLPPAPGQCDMVTEQPGQPPRSRRCFRPSVAALLARPTSRRARIPAASLADCPVGRAYLYPGYL